MDRLRSLFVATIACSLLAPVATTLGTGTAERSIVAIYDATQNNGTTRRSVNFYDVTAIRNGASSGVFNQTPLFSIWLGWENADEGDDFEDVGTIAVNPINGDVYALAFDSDTPGITDDIGDTQGDYDLYRLDYQAALKDFVDNGRSAGQMYAPTFGSHHDPVDNPSFQIDHPDHAGTTLFIDNLADKIGEVGRTDGGPFHDYDMEFIDPATLVLLDNQNGPNAFMDIPAWDHELRLLERVSTTNGGATPDPSPFGVGTTPITGSYEGGWNAGTTESWESDRLAFVDMDSAGGTRSEPEDLALVQQDGVLGVWVAESDTLPGPPTDPGDQIAFFEIDNTNADAVATKLTLDQLGNSRILDEDPELSTTSNDASHGSIELDADGNLIIVEQIFITTGTQTEPQIQRLNVESYDTGLSGGTGDVDFVNGDVWDDLDAAANDGLGPVGSDHGTDAATPPTPLSSLTGFGVDDDANVTNGNFSTYDPLTNQLYIFDADSLPLPNVVGDVYVVDLDTGAIVYQETNAADHFFLEHGLRFFTRGDTDGDGDVDGDDIDAFAAMVAGTALEQEMYDLTGDDSVVFGDGLVGSDSDELIKEILDTEYGDATLDGMIDGADVSVVQATLNNNLSAAGGWAEGDVNGDGVVDLADISILAGNHGFNNMPPALAPAFAAVPEPTSLALLALGGLVALRRRRH